MAARWTVVVRGSSRYFQQARLAGGRIEDEQRRLGSPLLMLGLDEAGKLHWRGGVFGNDNAGVVGRGSRALKQA